MTQCKVGKVVWAYEVKAQRDELLDVLLAVANEVAPGLRPYDTDSHLPQHLKDRIVAVIERMEEAK